MISGHSRKPQEMSIASTPAAHSRGAIHQRVVQVEQEQRHDASLGRLPERPFGGAEVRLRVGSLLERGQVRGEIRDHPALDAGASCAQVGNRAQIQARLRCAKRRPQVQPLPQRHQPSPCSDVGVPGDQTGSAQFLDRGRRRFLSALASLLGQSVPCSNEPCRVPRVEGVDPGSSGAQSHSHMSE